MKICWANAFDSIGNGYGYSTHARKLREACEKLGVESSPDGEIAVHIVTADRFKPIEGRINVLYTMYECTTVPKGWISYLQFPDLIVVPCRQNKELFGNYTKRPIEVCWEGVDTELYPFVEREKPAKDRPFFFLWVGAPNMRKGYKHVISAWNQWIASGRIPKNAILWMKTTGAGKFLPAANHHLILDSRDLPVEILAELYKGAHAFLLPSMGEGFGLTLAEAMSTGLPCVFTPWGGPRDFCSEHEGFPVKWAFRDVKIVNFTDDGRRVICPDPMYAAYADIGSILQRMEQIYHDYPAALERGRRAAQRIRDGFTWEHSAMSFMEILQRWFDPMLRGKVLCGMDSW